MQAGQKTELNINHLAADLANAQALADFSDEIQQAAMPAQPEYTTPFQGAVAGASFKPSKDVDDFVAQVLPMAQRVAKNHGVPVDAVIGQWGLETGFGKSVIPGTNNLGNIKDFSGRGVAAKDNMIGSVDRYRAYESGDAFADDFGRLLSSDRYRNALGTQDASGYFSALKQGGYAQDPDYVRKGVAAAGMVAASLAKVQQPAQTPTWAELAAKPQFAAMTPEQQRIAKEDYFETFVKPLAGDQADAVRAHFLGGDVPVADNSTAPVQTQPDAQAGQAAFGVNLRAGRGRNKIERMGEFNNDLAEKVNSVLTKHNMQSNLPVLVNDASGIPLRQEMRRAVQNAWDAATPEQRRALQAQKDTWQGQVASQRAEQFANLDASRGDAFAPLPVDTRVESRRARMILDGEHAGFAQTMSRDAALQGLPAGKELLSNPVIGNSDYDFETARLFNPNKPANGLNNAVTRGLAKAALGIGQTSLGIAQFGAEMLGADAMAKDFAHTNRYLIGRRTDAIGERGDMMMRNLEGAINSIGQQLPLMMGGAALKAGESFVLGGIAMQSFGQEYAEGREKGLTPDDATKRAGLMAAFEVIGERFGLGQQLQALRAAAKGMPSDQIAGLLMHALSKEVPGEILTTTGQFATDKFTAMGLHKDATFNDYLGQVADTVVQTLMQGGIMAGGTTGVSKAVRFMQDKTPSALIMEADALTAKDRAEQAWARFGEPLRKPSQQQDGVAPVVARLTGDGHVEPASQELVMQQAAQPEAQAPVQSADAKTEQAAPPADQVHSTESAHALDLAASRYQYLRNKRDGDVVQDADGNYIEQGHGQALTPAEQAEMQALVHYRGDAEKLAHFYGLNRAQEVTNPQQQPAVSSTPDTAEAHVADTESHYIVGDAAEPITSKNTVSQADAMHAIGSTVEEIHGKKTTETQQAAAQQPQAVREADATRQPVNTRDRWDAMDQDARSQVLMQAGSNISQADAQKLMQTTGKKLTQRGLRLVKEGLGSSDQVAAEVKATAIEQELAVPTVRQEAVDTTNHPTAKVDAAPTAKKFKPPTAKQIQAATQAYFTPGNIVESYAGARDRVISYTPPGANGERATVVVRAVEKRGNEWVDMPGEKERVHSTMPDRRALKQGPVERVATQGSSPVEAAQRSTESAVPPKADTAVYGTANKLVTADRAAQLRERLKKKLGQLNSGIDPEMLAIGTELAVFHVEAGARKFADFAQAMARDLDVPVSKIRQYLRGWYNGARDMMEDSDVSVDGMDSAEDVRAGLSRLTGKSSSAQASKETVYTPAGRAVDVIYKVVDAEHLTSSNDENGKINPDYPQALQPRDRTRAASIAQINDIANKINPVLLGKSASTTDGAPIVSKSGVVESGNGRTIALRQAYRNQYESASRYRAWLAEQGYATDGVAMPVLVRERQTEMTADELLGYTKESNERTTLDQSPVERAFTDARSIGDAIGQYGGGDITQSVNRDFVRSFMDLAVSPSERAGMMDSSGILSKTGRRRIEAAMMAAAYDSKELIADVFESGDTDIKAIGGALLDISGKWAQMRQAARAGSAPASVDITGNLIDAVNIVRRARAEDRAVVEFVDQSDMFGGAIDPNTAALMGVFYRDAQYKKPRGRDSMSDLLGFYAETARSARAGDNLFGEPEISGTDILKATNEQAKANEGTRDQQSGLFTTGTEPIGASDAAPGGQGQRRAFDATGTKTVGQQQEVKNAPSTRVDLERDSQESATQSVLEGDHGGRPEEDAQSDRDAGGRVRAEVHAGQQGAPELRAGMSVVDGKRGHQRLYTGERASEFAGIAAGDSFSERGGDIGFPRVPPEPISAATVGATATSGMQAVRARNQQRAARNVEIKSGIENVRQTLPALLPGQQEDVVKAETRFAKPNGYGMLFTNGTGTGKTYTGLGVIARQTRQGKNNILIIVPSEKIMTDWVDVGKKLDVGIAPLADTKDAGKGVVIATYANVGQNHALVQRQWDMVVADEAHTMMQSEDAKVTDALRMVRALTLHPDGVLTRFQAKYADKLEQLKDLQEQANAAQALGTAPAAVARAQEKIDAINNVLHELREAERAYVAENQMDKRPRALFLSATPFAYEKTVDWANGYLFDYAQVQGDAYNAGNGHQQFMMQHFGYRMRYNKLTAPEVGVDSGLMQRNFNSWLKREGVLSSRLLDVAADYDRRFVLIDSDLGNRIDAVFQWLDEQATAEATNRKAYQNLDKLISDSFNYLSRRYLLEAIKAEQSIPYVKKQLALGRKVVVFHDYKKGGGFNPFNVMADQLTEYSSMPLDERAALDTAVSAFRKEFNDLLESGMEKMLSPIDAYQKAFGAQVMLVNGDQNGKDMLAHYKRFNDDNELPSVMLVQSAKNTGWSGHDTTGKYQRVLVNLGQPSAPTMAIQQEGRIYRTGQKSDAIIRYFNTGTSWEKHTFAGTIARRASAAENLSLGEQARALKDSFIQAFEESDYYEPGHEGEGKGGKARDLQANAALTEWDRAKAYYFGTQKKTSKTKSQEGTDYFATPEPVGLKMVQWADMRPGEEAMEPSAGHGAIARWFPEAVKRTVVEPSSTLRARLALSINPAEDRVISGRFEDLAKTNKYNAIVMNPPFGVGGKTAMEHVDKAWSHLRDGGRLVALVPTGPAADKRLNDWLHGTNEKGEHLNPDAVLVADVALPTVTFERAGTGVATRVLVLEKQSDTDKRAQYAPARQMDLTGMDNIKDLFDKLEELEMPGRMQPIALVAEQATRGAKKPAAADASITTTWRGDEAIETYVTKKGKSLQGIWRAGLTKEQAQAIDPYTWQKGGKWFIREKHLSDSEDAPKFSRSADAVDQVDTPAFKRWFGDSKVVDSDGKPLVVYHATDGDFSVFDATRFGENTDSKASSEEWAQTARMGFWFIDRDVSGATGKGTVMPVYLSINNPKMYDSLTWLAERAIPFAGSVQELRAELESEGHDGLVVKDEEFGGTSYVAFRPEQIKSAIGNSGNFDPANPDIRYSRSESTKQAYEARIDGLFAGDKANLAGIRVLDRSDVLGLLSFGGKPVLLAEGKVIAGQSNHPLMTAAAWKKVPEWIENPAAVFESETDGGLVFIAPEALGGAPVSIIVRPDAGKPNTLEAHLLLNAYDRSTTTPFQRWINEGLLRYADTKKFPAILQSTSGRQLPGTALQNKPGTKRILTEKHLAGYRKANPSADLALSRGDQANADQSTTRVQGVVDGFVKSWANAPEVVVTRDMQDDRVPKAVRDYDAAMRSEGAEGVPEGFYYQGKVYLVASQLHTPMDVARVLFHETLGHHGLRKVFGKALDPILQQLASQRPAQVKKKAQEYGLDFANREHRAIAAEEVLAEMAQTHPELGYVKRAIAAVRQWLRKNLPGLANMRLTDADIIQSFIMPARQFVVRGGLVGDSADFPPRFNRQTSGSIDAASKTVASAIKAIGEGGKERFKTFSWYDKTLSTQYSKALKDPQHFGKVFGLLNAQQSAVSTTAIRPSELAPMVLPKVDGVAQAARQLVVGSGDQSPIGKAAKALFAGTLVGEHVLDGKVFTADDLRSQFGADDATIAAYQQTRAAVDASLMEVAAAEAFALAASYLPAGARRTVLDNPMQAKDFILGEFDKQINTAAKAMQGLALQDPDVAASIGAQIARMQESRTKVAQIFAQAKNLADAGYMPLMRFGDYTVTVTALDEEGNVLYSDDGERQTVLYQKYETKGEASAALQQVRRKYSGPGYLVEHGHDSKQSHELLKGVTPETIALFADVIGFDTVTQKYYEAALSERSALKRRLARKGTPGFSADLQRVLSSFITSNARLASQRYFSRDINNAIRYIPKSKGDVKDEAIALRKFMGDNKDGGAMASSLAFAWFLGGNAASAMVNLTQPVMMTAPYLTQFGNPLPHLTKAVPYAMGRKQLADPALRAALKRASQEGIVDAQEIFHLYSAGTRGLSAKLVSAAARVPGLAGKVQASGDAARARTQAFFTLWGSMFAAAEGFNRRLSFIAAYNMAKDQGQKDPYAFAVRAVNQTQGIYNKVSRPNWARSTVGRMLFTFKQYSLIYIELLARMYKAGPMGKRAALTMLAVLVLSAGEEGLPFAQDLDDLIDTIGQMFGLNTNMKRHKRDWAYATLGKTFGDLALYGVSAHMPLDFSGRLGLGNLVPGTGAFKASNTDAMQGREATEVLGPIFSLVGQGVDAIGAMDEGNAGKALLNLAPTAVRNAAAGVEIVAKGYNTDSRGRKVVDLPASAGVIKAIGFNPTANAQKNRAAGPLMQDAALLRKRQGQITGKLTQAVIDGDKQALDAAVTERDAWNARYPDTPIIIKPSTIRGRVKQATLDKDMRVMKSVPKAMRAQAVNAMASGAGE